MGREKKVNSKARKLPGWARGFAESLQSGRTRPAPASGPGPARPLPRTSRPVRPPPVRPPPFALLPLAVREGLRLSQCFSHRSCPLFHVFAAATAGGIRGSLTGLAPRRSRRFSVSSGAATEGGSPAEEPPGASVLALLPSPQVLEKRPRPGNRASRFQR